MTTPPRPLLLAGLGMLAAGAAAALAGETAPTPLPPILLTGGLALVLLGVVAALLPAFTGRESPRAPLAWLVPLAAALVVPAVVVLGILPSGWLLLPVLLALPLLGLRGPPVAGHEAPFDAGRPHRVGDKLALAAFGVGALGLLAGVALVLVAPRGLPYAGLSVLLLAGLLPLALGCLAFLLPRIAGAPLPGATLHATALGVLALAALAFAVAFSLLDAGGFNAAAAGVLLAHVLALVAALRLKLPPALLGPLAHARPLLRGAAALAPLAGLALFLATLGDAPSDLLPLAGYAHLVLALLLAAAATHLAAPFLGLAPRPATGWSKTGAALLIAGLFLLAPSFQYARSAFPGAFVLVLGALLTATPLVAAGRAAPRRRSKR